MIDRAARDAAALLVRQFRDGKLTNDDLEDRWPYRTGDRALTALASMLWRFYDDHRTHTLDNLHPETVAELTRYAVFLDTDLPYEWSLDRFDTIDWLGLTNRLTLGVIPALSKKVESQHQAISGEGDVTVWPFARAEDVPAELVR